MFSINRNRYYPNHTEFKEETTDHLPSGMYAFETEGGLFSQKPLFVKEEFREGLIPLKGEPFDSIFRRLNSFFSEETLKIYKDVQIRHFIGALIYGPPGTGKTCFIDLVCKHFADTKGAVVLRLPSSINLDKLSKIVHLMRNGDDTKMVIVLLEEIDKVFKGYGNSSEKDLIEFCDGTNTPTNVLMLASTNHMNKVPQSLRNRPSRFSIVEEVDAIPEEIAEQLISKFVPEQYRARININELAYKVTETKVTIDQVKWVVLNMLCDNLSVEKAIEATKTKAVAGIKGGDDEDEDD